MAKTHTPSEICGKDRGRQGKNQKSLRVKLACFWLLVAGYSLLVFILKNRVKNIIVRPAASA
jgi:hypothetical protein